MSRRVDTALDWSGLERRAEEARRSGTAQRRSTSEARAVSPSTDIERILARPRRPPPDLDGPRGQALVYLMTERLRRRDGHRCNCKERWGRCIDTLMPSQAWALYEMPMAGGLFGACGVGSGKCVAADTEVFDGSAARRRSVTEYGVLAVPSLVDERCLRNQYAQSFPSGVKPCFAITLADGADLTLSYDHKVYTHRGWIEAQYLELGDRVAVPTRIPDPLCFTEASDDEVALVAYMLSDGGCNRSSMTFTNATLSVVDDFQRLADAVCCGWSEQKSRTQAREFRVLGAGVGFGNKWYGGTQFRQRWNLYGLAKNKRVDARVWGLPRSQVALFINRFWACDGYVGANSLEITLASQKLIDDLRFLLLRLGVRSRKRYHEAAANGKKFDAWRLTVYGADAVSFLDEVGDVLGKEEACRSLRCSLREKNRNPNHDVVPISRSDLRIISDEMCALPSSRGLSPYILSRGEVRRALNMNHDTDVSRDRFISFCEEYGYDGPSFSRFAVRDLAWERLVDKRFVGDQPVYDLTVPSTHNFVANNIVVHNTVLDILSAMVLRPQRVGVLFVPSGLKEQLWQEYERVAEHFVVPSLIYQDGNSGIRRGRMIFDTSVPVVHVIPYSILQLARATALLEDLRPDKIFADEAHYLRNVSPSCARGNRFIRYIDAHPETEVALWSGTLVTKSLRDYAHLLSCALRSGSPLPTKPLVLQEWCETIDPLPDGRLPDVDPGPICRLMIAEDRGDVRVAIHRWSAETLGVVETKILACNAALHVTERKAPPIPERLKAMIQEFRETWIRPDGKQVEDALEAARILQQLQCGFWYRWVFPRGEPPELVAEWKDARKAWHAELRQKLHEPTPHLDSPFLCACAAARFYRGRDAEGRVVDRRASCDTCEASGIILCPACGGDGKDDCKACRGEGSIDCPDCGGHGGGVYTGTLPTWASQTWLRWCAVRKLVKPETEPVWEDDFRARDSAAWALEKDKDAGWGVVWCLHDAYGQKVAQIAGLPYHAGGPGAEARILAERGDRSVVASIRAHGTGRDGLQRLFRRQLVANPPSAADQIEQLLGRLHRIGQDADVVGAEFYRDTPEMRKAIDRSVRFARFVEGISGRHPLLLSAKCSFIAEVED